MNKMISLQFNEEEFVDALKELNLLVVSLDRLGSFYAEKPYDEFKEALCSFFVDNQVLRRLAFIRKVLHVAHDNSLTRVEIDAIEEQFKSIPYWTAPSGDGRKP